MNDINLETQIKELIVEALQLDKVRPMEIDPEAALFGEGLGLDSIDALELANALEAKFGVKFARSQKTDAAFRSVRTLAEYVNDQKKK